MDPSIEEFLSGVAVVLAAVIFAAIVAPAAILLACALWGRVRR